MPRVQLTDIPRNSCPIRGASICAICPPLLAIVLPAQPVLYLSLAVQDLLLIIETCSSDSTLHCFSLNMQNSKADTISLQTLPSELRKLIVSYLAPEPDSFLPGSKQDLKNANATHSCLREWTPEYVFRDMVLNHVLVGMSCQLERFAIDPSNSELLKFVKHIRVQVSTC